MRVPFARNPTIENFRPSFCHRTHVDFRQAVHPDDQDVLRFWSRTNCCSGRAFRSRQTRIANRVPVMIATRKNHCSSGKDREMSRSRVWEKSPIRRATPSR